MPRGPEPEPEEDMGARIRRLRLERGMTLARVAGGDFSRAFLSQVETGRSRPSTRVLTIIADRLGTRVDDILPGNRTEERELSLERARVAVLRGRPHLALQLLDEMGGVSDWPFSAETRLCALSALLAIGRRSAADALAQELREELTRRADEPRLGRLQDLESGTPKRLEARDHLRLAEHALRDGRHSMALEHFRAARILLDNLTSAETRAR